MGRTILNSLASVIVIVLMTVLLAEVVLRAWHYFSPSYIFESRTYLDRWRGQPGEFHFGIHLNSGGFLDVEVPPRRAETRRVIALGDSFAFGVVPYEDNYLTLLEERLSRESSWEVLNMGIPGTGPANYRELLISEGIDLDPDLVLVSLFIGNDLTDGLSEDGLDELLGVESALDRLKRAARSTFLYRALWYLFVVVPRLQAASPDTSSPANGEDWEYCESCMGTDWSTYLMIEGYAAEQFFTNIPSTELNVSRVKAELRAIREITDAHGIALAVVLIPDALQVDPELAEILIVREYEYNRDHFDRLWPNRLMHEALESLSIPYLDLTGVLTEAQRDGRVYIERNTHWNIRGNEIATDAIADFLIDGLDGTGGVD